MRIGEYIFYRMVALVLQVAGAVILVFAMLKLIPYDPTVFFLFGNRSTDSEAKAAQLQELRASLGLDKTLFEQWIDYLINLITNQSLGTSWNNGTPIMEMISTRLPYTFITFGIAFLIYTPLAIGMGIIAANYRGGVVDTIMRVITTATYSVPVYVLGLWFILYANPNSSVPWKRPSPVGFIEIIMVSGIPILVVVLAFTGFQFRLVRAQMLEILRADYIRTARAKGLKERTILYKHAFRNGLPFFITTIAVTFPIAFSGVAALEVVFQIPGIGLLMVGAANTFDWPVLVGVTTIFTMINAFLLGLTDVVIHVVDPKLRLGERFSHQF